MTPPTCRLNEMVLTLQDKEKNVEHSTGALEKEISIKNQALEHHKRKAQESIQVPVCVCVWACVCVCVCSYIMSSRNSFHLTCI